MTKLQTVLQELREQLSKLTVENNLWTWIHEEMGCFVQQSSTLDDTRKWAVVDVDENVIAEGPTPLDAMRAAEKS